MQFIRAPDENVFIPPFNLIEVFLLVLPFEWWMNKRAYKRLNDIVMAIIYSPLLLVAAYFETRKAAEIRANRARGQEDDDIIEEWEQMAGELDFEADGWKKTVDAVKPNLDDDPAVLEVRKLKEEVDELKNMMAELGRAVGAKQVRQGQGETE